MSLPLLQQLCDRGNVLLISRRAYLDLLPPDCNPQFLDCDSPQVSALYNPGATCPDGLKDMVEGSSWYVFQREDPDLQQRLLNWGACRTTWLDPRPESRPHIAVQFTQACGFPDVPLDRPIWPRQRCGNALWIHPGSGSLRKNADPACFAASAAMWQKKLDGEVLLSFGEADEAIRSKVEAVFAEQAITFSTVEGLTLGRLKSMMQERATHYLGNDSGVSHLAGALGIPSDVIFRCSDPAIWRPLGPVRIHTGEEAVQSGIWFTQASGCGNQN